MDDPSRELFSRKAFPELAAVLRAALKPIVRRWEVVVRETLPSADELTLSQIRDDLPRILEHASKALESDRPFETRKFEEVAPTHGEVRFHQGFRLEELMTEYSILRPIVLDETTQSLNRAMTIEEAAALMATLDVVTQQTTLEFVAHQNQQLHAANEAQSKYLSFLSHDLRGGLNGVCLMIEVLRRELMNEEKFKGSVDDLDMMRRSIFETIATMDRFLHAERFRKGKVPFRPGRVNLKHMLMEVSAHLTYQAKDRGVELVIDAPNESEVVSDKDLLAMILHNVTGNAIKYGPRAPVKMIASRAQNGGAWRISVSDRGQGIPSDKLAELFGTFTRGANTQGQPGVGLGLSIARQAADLIGAKLWAESDGKTGSTFHLELPSKPVEVKA